MSEEQQYAPEDLPPREYIGASTRFRRMEAAAGWAEDPQKRLPRPLRDKDNASLQAELLAVDEQMLEDYAILKRVHFKVVAQAEKAIDEGADEKLLHQHVRRFQMSSNQLKHLIPTHGELAKKIATANGKRGIKQDFMHERAVKVVEGVLFEMDKAYEDEGFGAWMPFAFPDQWIMFTGAMSRVLAANGLLHAKNPEQYRRFFEETPFVERIPKSQVAGGSKLATSLAYRPVHAWVAEQERLRQRGPPSQ
ncbi:MAG: hypothetical protein KF696_05580 [Planctomycetes bacterium]|nr:hypothetical protein [Planctomycetota bacterium]MCW8136357.1 hypothetical protein [Planctomycetota bacterium]